jgi:selenocysteine lyase/cysteine desulfurase
VDDLRAQFPVLEHSAYLNAGTTGPLPRRALEAAEASLRDQAECGRGSGSFFEGMFEQDAALRAGVARLLRCAESELTVTGATTDSVNAALLALDLRRGDEVLTSDEEHPGVLAPLAVARATRGVRVRVVPFAELPGEVRASTRIVACSHVSWITGRVMDTDALASCPAIVLLDGAQGLGALTVDARSCDFYAASGQKWLCGPNGLGYLYARAELSAELPPPWPGYHVLEDPHHPLDSPLHTDARRLGTGLSAPHQLALASAALSVLEEAGIEAVYERGAALAAQLAGRLAERGLEVAPRGRSTLVAFAVDDPGGFVERAAAAHVVVRSLPGTHWVRASVGAWSNEDDLERLLALLPG